MLQITRLQQLTTERALSWSWHFQMLFKIFSKKNLTLSSEKIKMNLMKKTSIAGAILAVALLFVGCKNEKTVDVENNNLQETTTIEVDTVAAKKLIEAEKETLAKPYNENEDAQAAIDKLLLQAKAEGKNIFVQAGGNWCIWCLRFNDFIEKDTEIKAFVAVNYLYYHLNYSKNNKNKDVFNRYVPEARNLGYPFFFVLSPQGEVLNVIGSGDLEANKSYDPTKVMEMFAANTSKK